MAQSLTLCQVTGNNMDHDGKNRVLTCRNTNLTLIFFFSSRRRHTRYIGDWSSDVCSPICRTRLRDIVERVVMRQFAVDRDTALRDAEMFVTALANHGVLRVAGQPFVTAGAGRQEMK